MTKIKPVASGVDISNLTPAQLEALSVEAKARAIELADSQANDAIQALKNSGELDALKKEFLAIVKESKKLQRKANFDIVVPIRFTMKSESPVFENPAEVDFSVFDYDFDESDIFHHEFEANLIKTDLEITRKQRDALSHGINDYVSNACEEIFDLVPEPLMKHYEDFTDKLKTFRKKVEDRGITLENLQ